MSYNITPKTKPTTDTNNVTVYMSSNSNGRDSSVTLVDSNNSDAGDSTSTVIQNLPYTEAEDPEFPAAYPLEDISRSFLGILPPMAEAWQRSIGHSEMKSILTRALILYNRKYKISSNERRNKAYTVKKALSKIKEYHHHNFMTKRDLGLAVLFIRLGTVANDFISFNAKFRMSWLYHEMHMAAKLAVTPSDWPADWYL